MARDRRGQAGGGPGAGFNDIKPDPSRIGGVAEAPFVRLPNPATLFASRAARLLVLAEGHIMGDYLRFLAWIVQAQAALVVETPGPAPIPTEQRALRAGHGMPPISEAELRGGRDLLDALHALLGTLDAGLSPAVPVAAAEALASVRAMTDAEQLTLAADIFAGSFPLDRVAESLFVAAALQVHLARLAAPLAATDVTPAAEGICPVCGGAPVSSLVVGWTQASKARYCACSLCGTLWNHVRIKCTACGSTEGITYLTIEDGPKTVGVEACGTCRSYIKHMQQHEDPGLDPVADDVASYALDLLATNDDYRRSSINPIFLT